MPDVVDAFLLTQQWRDGRRGVDLTLWGVGLDGPVRVDVRGEAASCFVPHGTSVPIGSVAPTDLTDLAGEPVDRWSVGSRAALRRAADELRARGTFPLESDVKPSARYLQGRGVTGAIRVRGRARRTRRHLAFRDPVVEAVDLAPPALRVLSFDIETDGPDGALLSIAYQTREEEGVCMVGEGPAVSGVAFLGPDEASVLRAFLAAVDRIDPDVLVGWNCIEFDLRVLEALAARCRVPFTLGRAGGRATVLSPRTSAQPYVARVPGRVVVDGIAALRNATWSFESFALEHVARRLLGRGKAIRDPHGDRVAEIRRLYHEDKAGLAAYNLQDCRLVLDILDRAHLIAYLVERQRLTGLPMDRIGGAVAAFDNLYLPRLHAHGHVAPDVGRRLDAAPSPGGDVMESTPGLYENVLVLDFKSLYPSIIRTFGIDPMGLAFPGDDPVPGFLGATFHRERHILPGLIETLWAARDRAKARGDEAASRALKIQMNSFYGVLGTPGCRFFDPRLATSITRRGHEILLRSRRFIEERGLEVIYGDTDSLFVLLGAGPTPGEAKARGEEVAVQLNAFWRGELASTLRVESALELRFETHFRRFFMPTLRDSEHGTKKRYAGLVERDGSLRVVMRGLEAVRTDQTPLARRFQRELYRRVFLDEPYAGFIREVSDDLFAGRLDDELIYRKRLRRDLDEYTHHVPPHVAAARRLPTPVRTVEYVMTTQGPEPVGYVSHPLDYRHYLDRQLAPAAEALLSALGERFERLGGRQLSLF
ncbi:MAG: DNA polymerase II [Sandaracinaceae bacterium]